VRALRLIAAGLVLVAVDFRVQTVDILFDPGGWALVAWGAYRLTLRSPVVPFALLAAVASLPESLLPHAWVRLDPATGAVVPEARGAGLPQHLVYPEVTGWRLAGLAFGTAVAGIALALLLAVLAVRARAWGAGAAPLLRRLAWVVPAVAFVPPLVGMALAVANDDGSYDAVWNGRIEPIALMGVVALLVTAAVLYREGDQRWAVPTDGDRPSPWSVLRSRLRA
jgi:hypothetical protein